MHREAKESKEPEILADLSEAEKHAVRLVKTTLDCFNSADGIGLFSGMARYHALEGRLTVVATQSRSLFEFWGILLRKMMWPTPPKRMDSEVIELIQKSPDDRLVLKAIASQTASVVMLARYWHDETKAERRELEKEWREIEEAAKEAAAKKEGALDV